MTTFYWYDLETFGRDCARDRIAQFAGQRTDAELRPIGDPCVMYCQPARDFLPDPGACLITGITPQEAQEKGINEAGFSAEVLRQFAPAGTCVAGYNSLRFDDEFLRYLFYRNFHDPYAREYQGGNSRWDLIDVMRLAHLLRPEGLNWPQREDGATSFRLEDLTRANGIEHAGAHDALVDVRATIAIAARLRSAQPKLFDYLFSHRGKHDVLAELDVRAGTPVLHVSGMIPATLGSASLFMPLAAHPTNRNSVICYDLRVDPQALLELDAAELQRRVFSSREELAGEERVPLKEIHANRCPVVLPAKWVNDDAARRMDLDLAACRRHWQTLHAAGASGRLQAKLRALYQRSFDAVPDAEYALYGGFLPDQDREACARIRSCAPEELLQRDWRFEDPRMADLLLRYVGRNFPQHLAGEHLQAWRELCQRRLREPGAGARDLAAFQRELADCRTRASTPREQGTLDAVADWAGQLCPQDAVVC